MLKINGYFLQNAIIIIKHADYLHQIKILFYRIVEPQRKTMFRLL